MTDTKQSRGFAGAVLKLLRAGDYELTIKPLGARIPIRLTAGEVAERALLIAADICVYTNTEIIIEELA